MVHRWIGTCNVAEELKASGADDVHVSGGRSVRRWTSSLEMWALQEILYITYAADTTGQTHPDSWNSRAFKQDSFFFQDYRLKTLVQRLSSDWCQPAWGDFLHVAKKSYSTSR